MKFWNKVGDKIICKKSFLNEVKKGQAYTVVFVDEEYIFLDNKYGFREEFYEYFQTLTEFRNSRINEILK